MSAEPPDAAAEPGDESRLDAGHLARWLADTRRVLAGQADAEVACRTCTACCRSSQFVHIGPDETDTLANIPRELLFPAPLMPRGYRVLGYDERGWCPMLTEAGCSIYEHRPRTCRMYDCRIFAATRVDLDDPDKQEIAVQSQRWDFSLAAAADRRERAALDRAARELATEWESSVDAPASATARAVLITQRALDA
jgi:Fe-S-cluster containining protein